MRDGTVLARHVNLLSALTSEIRHTTHDGEIRHFVTPLNSGDTATLLPGTRHASVQNVDFHMRNARRLQLALTYAVAAICGICSADP
jgi:hypothetical protein